MMSCYKECFIQTPRKPGQIYNSLILEEENKSYVCACVYVHKRYARSVRLRERA